VLRLPGSPAALCNTARVSGGAFRPVALRPTLSGGLPFQAVGNRLIRTPVIDSSNSAKAMPSQANPWQEGLYNIYFQLVKY
jgi:hypothetical protein